jgi:hypothetical protein
MKYTLTDFVDEWKILTVRVMHGSGQGITQPLGIVARYLMSADLENGAVADECDHWILLGKQGRGLGVGRMSEWLGSKKGLVFEQTALQRITRGATLEGLDFVDKFTYVIELSVNGNITDVGNGVDRMEFVHDFGTDRRGGDLGQMVFVQIAQNFFHRSIQAIHGDGSFFAGLDQATK